MYIIHYSINPLTVDAFGPRRHQPWVKIQCKHNTGILCVTVRLCKISLLLTTVVSRVVKHSRLPPKITAYLVSIGPLLCLEFLCGWHFLIKYPWTGRLLFCFFTCIDHKQYLHISILSLCEMRCLGWEQKNKML